MLKGAKAYLNMEVSTASQGELLLMLYDTAIKHLHDAAERMRAGDFAKCGVLIGKALAIISELRKSLNMQAGGKISQNLFQLYCFCNTHLLRANLKRQPEMVEDAVRILAGLRGAFAEIIPQRQSGMPAVAQKEPAEEAAVTPPAGGGAEPAAADVPAASDEAAEEIPYLMPAGPLEPVAFAKKPEEKPAASAPAKEAASGSKSAGADFGPDPTLVAPVPGSPYGGTSLRLRAASAYSRGR